MVAVSLQWEYDISSKVTLWKGWMVLGFLAMCLGSSCKSAFAQSNPPPGNAVRSSTAFDIQQFRPGSDPKGMLQTYSAENLGQWNFFLGVFFHYGWDPLFLIEEGKEGQIDVMRHQLAADIGMGIGFLSWLDLHVSVPVTLFQDGELPAISRLGPAAGRILSGVHMRDVQVRLRFQLLQEKKHGVSLGVMPSLGIPSGNAEQFNGEGAVSFGLTAMMSRRWSRAAFSLNFGYRFLDETEFLGLFVGHELTYSLGLRVDAIPSKVSFVADLSGVVGLTSPGVASSPMGLFAGLRLFPMQTPTLALNIGVGIGLISGYGSPKFRAIFGFVWSPQFGSSSTRNVAAKDSDRDGTPDTKDRCPRLSGPVVNEGCPVRDKDFDGVPDNVDRCPGLPGVKANQGCPTKDSDGDGVPDYKDRCKQKSGPKTNQGCPTSGDRDGDGVSDKLDLCPTVPGVASSRGCPSPNSADKDGDGVRNEDDKCPERPGVKANRGCPLHAKVARPRQPSTRLPPTPRVSARKASSAENKQDSDNDGVSNADDRCPLLSGSRRRRGCPRRKYIVVSLRKKRIYIRRLITFYRQTRLRRRSRRILRQVAEVMKNKPSMTVRIVAVTHSRSRRRWVRGLSWRRARSVYFYLRRRGVNRKRLSYRGYRRYWRRSYTRTYIRIYIRKR